MLSDQQSLRCVVKRKIVNTPTSEKFPNLYQHRALNRKNTVTQKEVAARVDDTRDLKVVFYEGDRKIKNVTKL